MWLTAPFCNPAQNREEHPIRHGCAKMAGCTVPNPADFVDGLPESGAGKTDRRTLHHIFVYGTLRPGEKYHRLIEKFVVTARPAFVRGRLYHLPEGYPALVLERDLRDVAGWQSAGPGNVRHHRPADLAVQVRGDLLGFADLQPVLPILDELEDYYGPGDPRNVYERVAIWAAAEDGNRLQSLVYVYSQDKLGWLENHAVWIPGGDWVKWKSGQ